MSQIDHLGIAVKSLAEAKKFYQKLGLQVMPRNRRSRKVRLAMVRCESRIELLEQPRLTRDCEISRQAREGLHHVALQVTIFPLRSSG